MSRKRETDEKSAFWLRSDRLEEVSGQWFFHTREGTTEGPFQDRLEAICMLHTYIEVATGGILSDDCDLALAPLEMEKVG